MNLKLGTLIDWRETYSDYPSFGEDWKPEKALAYTKGKSPFVLENVFNNTFVPNAPFWGRSPLKTLIIGWQGYLDHNKEVYDALTTFEDGFLCHMIKFTCRKT